MMADLAQKYTDEAITRSVYKRITKYCSTENLHWTIFELTS